MKTCRICSPLDRHLKSGQSLVEYAIILALVVVVIILVLAQMGVSLTHAYCLVLSGLDQNKAGNCSALIADGFDNLDDWSQFWRSPNTRLEDGKLCMKGDGRILNKTKLPNDYKINMDYAQLSSGDGYAIMFRLNQSGNNYAGYSFQIDPGLGNQFAFRRYDKNGAELSRPLSMSKAPANFDWHSPHNVQVVVEGSTFKGYVDGNLVLTATDNTYPSGQAGLRTWDNTDACFDNFTVTGP
jgi:Flp pilus assembly pilin Flp